jgi:Leu/Phe-tRNA-protein transferase
VVSHHLVTLGARLMPRAEFSALLDRACDPPARHENWPPEAIPVDTLFIA